MECCSSLSSIRVTVSWRIRPSVSMFALREARKVVSKPWRGSNVASRENSKQRLLKGVWDAVSGHWSLGPESCSPEANLARSLIQGHSGRTSM